MQQSGSLKKFPWSGSLKFCSQKHSMYVKSIGGLEKILLKIHSQGVNKKNVKNLMQHLFLKCLKILLFPLFFKKFILYALV